VIDGQVVNDLPPKERDIAMVFQNYALYPHMNAHRNMGFALKMKGIPRDEIDRRVREAARILGLTDSLEKKPRTLSGGQRQRVAMGRAIVRQPQAFLMDEPLSNLDAKLRVEMRAEISRIQRDLGVTTVYVTHDQVEALTMGDRVAVMRNGLLQQVDKPQVLYERPRNLFVAEFIGSPAMNLVAAELARSDGDVWVRFGEHRLRLDPPTLAARPALADYEGREVVVGIRPEDMEDAAVLRETHPDRRMSVVCDIREDMGSEVYAHFNVAAKAVTTEEVVEALVVEDLEDEEARLAAERARGAGVPFVARLERQTEARERRPLELEVDVTRLHFFDPETGLGVGERGDGVAAP
jgi:multiple sugar transport system ATP-binding protein